MQYDAGLLWIAASEEHSVVTYNPSTGETEEKLTYLHEVWDVCPDKTELWMGTGGGKLGRQLVLWSLKDEREIRKFDCPDGAGAGMTLFDEKLWITHRHNRKLFCLDSKSGKVNWTIRTEHETFSPVAYKGEFWFIESDPGPLGHWNETKQGKYFFSRYDPARERIMERIAVPFIPRCMAFDGIRFWYSEQGKGGLASTEKNLGRL
jgi:glutamine cyclotransferase